MKFRNWSRSVEFSPREIVSPSSIEKLQEIVLRSSREQTRVRVVGAGHSFTPLIETSQTLVRIDELKTIGECDAAGVVPVGAGVRLWELGPRLRQMGRAQENLGDINAQSIAGAISTGTHGTGLSFGAICTQAQWLRVLTASGELKHWDRDKDPDAFRAAATSLGSLGILIEVGLRTVPAYGLECRQFAESLDTALSLFSERIRQHRHHEFFWFPHTRTVLSKLSDALADPGREPSKISRFIGDVIVENGVFELINQTVRMLPSQAPRACRSLAALSRLAGSKTLRGPSDLVFATARLSRFQEMEYGLPLDNLGLALERIERFIVDRKIAVSFPVEVRCVKGDDLWISPAQGYDSVFMAVHMHHALPFREYFDGVERIFRDLGGRPHWGKLHTLEGKDFQALYPRWKDFVDMRSRLDPGGVFLNSHLEKLFGL